MSWDIANQVESYLVVSVLLFALGLFATLTRRNAIGLFLGVELMLNSAALNFVAFASFTKRAEGAAPPVDGSIFALFIIVFAAVGAATALAIVLRYFASAKSIDPTRATELRG